MTDKLGSNINMFAIKSFFVNFLVPLVCLGIITILGLLVLYPSFKSLPNLKKDLEETVTLENQLSTKVASLNRLLDFKKIVDENEALVSNVLVSESMVPQLLTQIDTIAKESGLVVDKLSYSFGESTLDDNVTAPAASNVNVSLGVTGSYAQAQVFLDNLEKAARLINVSTLRYTLSERKEDTALDINFSLSSPYQFVSSNAVTDDAINVDITDKDFVSFINKIKTLRVYNVAINDAVVTKAAQESSASAR